MYAVPIGNSVGLVITLSPMMMDAEGSSRLRTIKILQCFTGRFTVLPESELPNAMMTGVV